MSEDANTGDHGPASPPRRQNVVSRLEPGTAAEIRVPHDVGRRYDRRPGQPDTYLFPGGTVTAFETQPVRIVLHTENPQVTRDALAIAAASGWRRVQADGSEAFRALAWTVGRERGLAVDGHAPSELEKALVQPRQRLTRRTGDDPDAVRAQESPARELGAFASRQTEVAPEPGKPRGRPRGRTPLPSPGDITWGRLSDWGPAPYKFRESERRSFYVRIETTTGPKELWGMDLSRAMSESVTRPQRGDEIGVQFRGSTVLNVPVQASRRDVSEAEGSPSVRRKLNTWRIESRDWYEERLDQAHALRSDRREDKAPPPRSQASVDAVLIARAAEVFARERIADAGDRARFEQVVRRSLASSLELGERVPAIRLSRSPGTDRRRDAEMPTDRLPTERSTEPSR